jgi:hypothetical protein
MTISSKNTIASRIRAYLRENPKAKPDEVVKALGVKRENVYAIKQYDRLRAKRIRMAKKIADQPVNVSNIKFGDNVGGLVLTDVSDGKARWVKAPEPLPITMHDPVNHPEHYKVGGIETIDFIEAKQLSYNLGNVVKYLTRADHKGNRLQDLQKAQWYLEREIKNIQG